MPDTQQEQTTTTTIQDLHDEIREQRATLGRIERAVIGDPSIGHIGLVDRTLKLEALEVKEWESHAKIADERATGDRRLHERIDGVETTIAVQIKELMEEQRTRDDKIERKIDRFIWVILGTGIGSAAAGFGGAWAILA